MEFALEQNYPNPFNPATTIEYRTSTAGIATLTVFDILGREVASLVNRVLPAGIHRARLDGSALPSGVYFVRLEAGGKSGTRKIMLVK